MAEELFTDVEHDGVLYEKGTAVSKVKNLSDEQKEALKAAGAVGEPAVPSSVQTELEEKSAEVEALKVKIAALEAAKAQANADAEHKAAVEAAKK